MACVVEHEEFERFGWISGPEYKVQCIHKGRAEALSKTLACRFALPVSHKLPSGASCGANISGKPSLCLLHHTVHRKNLHTHYWPSLFPLLLQVKLWTVPSRTPLSLPEYIWIFQNTSESSRIHLNLPGYIWIFQNTSESSRIHLNLPEYTWIFQSYFFNTYTVSASGSTFSFFFFQNLNQIILWLLYSIKYKLDILSLPKTASNQLKIKIF